MFLYLVPNYKVLSQILKVCSWFLSYGPTFEDWLMFNTFVSKFVQGNRKEEHEEKKKNRRRKERTKWLSDRRAKTERHRSDTHAWGVGPVNWTLVFENLLLYRFFVQVVVFFRFLLLLFCFLRPCFFVALSSTPSLCIALLDLVSLYLFLRALLFVSLS